MCCLFCGRQNQIAIIFAYNDINKLKNPSVSFSMNNMYCSLKNRNWKNRSWFLWLLLQVWYNWQWWHCNEMMFSNLPGPGGIWVLYHASVHPGSALWQRGKFLSFFLAWLYLVLTFRTKQIKLWWRTRRITFHNVLFSSSV